MDDYVAYGTEVVVVSDEFQESLARKGKEVCDTFAAEDPTFKMVYDQQTKFFKTYRHMPHKL